LQRAGYFSAQKTLFSGSHHMLRLVIFPANVEPSRFLDVIITPAVSNREPPGMVVVPQTNPPRPLNHHRLIQYRSPEKDYERIDDEADSGKTLSFPFK
jgi:hypothetical protein